MDKPLLEIDRDVEKVHRALLCSEGTVGEEDDPFEVARYVSGKTTYDALMAMSPGVTDTPLRDALVLWVVFLLSKRVERPAVRTLRRALSVKATTQAGTPPRTVSAREVPEGLLASRTEAEAAPWIAAWAERAPELVQHARTVSDRREEIARRLGIACVDDLLLLDKSRDLATYAAALLDETDSLWASLHPGDASARSIAPTLAARDAGTGWPAHLTVRWFGEIFPDASRSGFALPKGERLPTPLGATSFARALEHFGRHGAPRQKSLAFTLSREPVSTSAYVRGLLLSSVVLTPSFQKRILSVGGTTLSAQLRLLWKAALWDVRLASARVLVHAGAGDEDVPRRIFGHVPQGFVFPLPQEDALVRLSAQWRARDLTLSCVQRFDEDWFRNPRAWPELATHREQSREFSPREQAAALARTFEKELG